jgi:hypothetical protein
VSSPFSGFVLLGAALVSSPAIHAAVVEATMSYETALIRFAVAWVVVWIGVSMISSIGSASTPTQPVVPRSLPGVDGPVSVRPAELHTDGSSKLAG